MKQKHRAICWASGLIEFIDTPQPPDGAITIAMSRDRAALEKLISGNARHGYNSKPDANGRITKECLLVPGVPEAGIGTFAAVDALTAWCNRLRNHAPASVTVL